MNLLTPNDIETQEFDCKSSMFSEREWYSADQVDDFLDGPVAHTIEMLARSGLRLQGKVMELQNEIEQLKTECESLKTLVCNHDGMKSTPALYECDDIEELENDCE